MPHYKAARHSDHMNTRNITFIGRVGVAVTFLTRVQAVLGSHLGRDITYHKVFRDFTQMPGEYLYLAMTVSFQIMIHLPFINSTLFCPATESVIKQATNK